MQEKLTGLNPHPVNERLYGEEVLPEGFIDSIRQRGILTPLAIKQDGTIISGHRRWRAARLLNIDSVPVVYVSYDSELDEREAVIDFNRQREKTFSQMMAEAEELETIESERAKQRQEAGSNQYRVVETFPQGKPGKTRDKVAEKTGIGSGRTYDRAKQVWEAAKTGNEEAEKWVKQIDNGNATVNKAYTEVNKAQRKTELENERRQLAKKAQEVKLPDRWNIEQADINTWQTLRQYDYIITDPPYPKEYLHLYGILAKRANEWLKPGGLLVAMCGQSYLNQIYEMMSKHLKYYWTACYFTPGQPKPLRQVNVNTSWKPLLMFKRNNEDYKGKIFGDVFKSDANDKDFHVWGQSESGMMDIISKVCLSGQYILDPFCGAGTTGVAALKHGCLFDGIDIKKENVDISRSRLYDTTTQ